MKFVKWRFPLSMLVLAVFVALFLLHGEGWIFPRKAALATQFTTDITRIGGKMLFAAVLLVLTVAFGRFYCALLCPAGLVQDLFSRLGRRLRLSRLRYARPPFAVNLAFMAAAVVLGGVVLLDPIAMFGALALPAGGLLNQGEWGLWRLYSSETAALAALGVVMFLLIVVPVFWGRVFCDVVCPVGTLFRLAGRLPGKRLAIAAEKCVSCGKCAAACPARCADDKEKRIDDDRCLLCLDCADACKPGAVAYRTRGDGDRRGFLGSAGAAALGGAFVFSREAKRRFGAGYADGSRVAPPGAGGAVAHAASCVGCQACVIACPAGIIRTDGVDSRPVLDFRYGYCQYNCADCLRSCPAGVFRWMELGEKQTTRLARVELRLERCVVETRDEACGACAEVCPTHAVVMVEREGGKHTIPDFDGKYCIGCGGCFHVCPAYPRAFALEGLERHETASGIRPVEHGHGGERLPDDTDAMTDFPF